MSITNPALMLLFSSLQAPASARRHICFALTHQDSPQRGVKVQPLALLQAFRRYHGILSMRSAALQGPAFDAEARRPQGRVFSWIDRMLRGPHAHDGPPSAGGPLRSLGPSKAAVARTALLNMLSANHDVLPVYVHQCYSAELAIACTYFQALSNQFLQQPHAMLLPECTLTRLLPHCTTCPDVSLHTLAAMPDLSCPPQDKC